MTIEQLRCFVAVCEEGTVSAAARRLHLTQPPVSLQLKNLEGECGVLLVERGPRQVTLTEAGRQLYRYAVQITQLVGIAEMDIENFRIGRQGSLRIGVVSSGTCQEFFDGVREFQNRHAGVCFEVTDGNTYTLLDALDRQQIELALIRTPYPTRDLEAISIRTDEMTAAGLSHWFERVPDEIPSLSSLADRSLIIYRRWEKILREAFERENQSMQVYCINDDARTSLQWARADLGIALVPASALWEEEKSLEVRKICDTALETKICLVRRTDRILSESARLFWETFAGLYAEKRQELPKGL